jgi:hypothetical protein
MDDRQKIQDRLRKKEQEIQGLEERLRNARTYLSALQDILKLLGDNEDRPAANSSRASLRAGSGVDQARQVILRSGAPVHISALVEAMGQDTREGRISLASSLAAYVRKGEIFTRPAPNTFGLIELGHRAATRQEDAPPAGFGQMSPPVSPSHISGAITRDGGDDGSSESDDIPF